MKISLNNSQIIYNIQNLERVFYQFKTGTSENFKVNLQIYIMKIFVLQIINLGKFFNVFLMTSIK